MNDFYSINCCLGTKTLMISFTSTASRLLPSVLFILTVYLLHIISSYPQKLKYALIEYQLKIGNQTTKGKTEYYVSNSELSSFKSGSF